MDQEWRRPDLVKFPTTWVTFNGRKVLDGKTRQFWIQDIDEELAEEVIKYMTTQFAAEEPLSKYANIWLNNAAKEEFATWLTICLKDKTALVCLMEDDNGVKKITGMNCTYVSQRDDKRFEVKTKNGQQLYSALDFMYSKFDVYQKFQVNAYLNAMGLYVLPEYRGEGIGLELLKARKTLCEAVGLKVTLTIFTSKASQVLAERVGFRDLFSIAYEDFIRESGNLKYRGIENECTHMRLMYLQYK